MTIALGLEGSANKLAIAIVKYHSKDNMETLCNCRHTYSPPTGFGFLPRDTAQHHQNYIIRLILQSFISAKIPPSKIDVICYTKGPGMGAPLRIVAIVARILSQLWKKPLVGVNHCIGHIECGRVITQVKDPIVLYVSGGNTQVIAYARKRYRIFGETIDTAIGNCLDRFARLAGIPNYPAPGANIEKEALKATGPYIQIPYSVKGMDMSFAGLESFLKSKALPALKQNKFTLADLCYSLQETVFAMLVEVTERALAHCGKSQIIIVGGVGCNKRLQSMMKQMADQRGATMAGMDLRYCIDNGAMIAIAGLLEFMHGRTTDLSDSWVSQRFRTDAVQCIWRDE